jgi:hypothetical protein
MLIGSIGGPILEAELFPLSGQGRLRVTYHWMYSALNCDPRDESRFVWTLMRFSNGQVALTPRHAFEGRTLFASVRDDWNWYVQVQAPRSAHWITQPLRNERLEIEGQDLLMISLRGFNGQHIAVDAEPSRHGNHAGIACAASAPPLSSPGCGSWASSGYCNPACRSRCGNR